MTFISIIQESGGDHRRTHAGQYRKQEAAFLVVSLVNAICISFFLRNSGLNQALGL